ncbi:MAG TPA: hypothetical protein VF605_11860 [Allosphingosinicella sp.]|jgi:hypothetical protein
MTIAPLLLPFIRRAILDLLNDAGGEHNDEVLAMLLVQLGHRIARRDVREQLRWLATAGGDDCQLVALETLDPYLVARIRPDGRDVADGRLLVDGIWKHKTGE